MPTAYYSRVLHAAPDKVWSIVRDFKSAALWHPFVTECRVTENSATGLVGSVRLLRTQEGYTFQERLLELSELDRRTVYQLESGDIPLTRYLSRVQVHPITATGGAFVSWSVSYDTDADAGFITRCLQEELLPMCLNCLAHLSQERRGTTQ